MSKADKHSFSTEKTREQDKNLNLADSLVISDDELPDMTVNDDKEDKKDYHSYMKQFHSSKNRAMFNTTSPL